MGKLDELKSFKKTLVNLYSFLNETNLDSSIHIIDPDNDLCGFGYSLHEATEWVTNEIAKEERYWNSISR
jgi:hypothetical protein